MLYFVAVMAALAITAQASPPAPVDLEPVVVIATRTERPISDVAALVDLIDSSELATEQVSELSSLARYHVGIDAESAGTRFGANGLSIRGIGGNRVAMELDGVPLSDQFSIGSYSNAGRALVDPELLSRIEVLRGPASSLYGSDAIGGVVGFFTWRPQDLAGGQSPGYRLRMGHDAASNSNFASAVGGWQTQRFGAVAGIVARRGDTPDYSAPSTTKDPIDTSITSAMLRLEADIGAGHSLSLAAGSYESERESQLNSPLGYARFRTTTLLEGDDRQTHNHVQLGWRADVSQLAVDSLTMLVSHRNARTDQLTREERASRDQRYERHFFYDQATTSARLMAYRDVATDSATHRVAFGIDAARVETKELRDATQSALDGTGATTTILGEVFPLRDFPITRTRTASFWLQDEIQWPTVTLIPSLRYEHYRLTPSRDDLYLQGDDAVDVVSVNESQWTPRLGALWKVGGGWSWFGQYAAGFRAPPFEDVNVGLDLPFFNIRAIPNADLKSETSHSFELGVRKSGAVHSIELAAFHNRYKDFIETRVPVGVDPVDGATLFQSRNIARATIEGAELRYRLDPQGVLSPFALRAELLTIRGEDDSSGAALASVSPDEALVGVSWHSPADTVSLEVIGRAARGARPRADSPDNFTAHGYGVFDVLGRWQPRPGTQLRVALLNLTDRVHWTAQAVRNIDAGDPMLALLSAPGRSVAVSIETRF